MSVPVINDAKELVEGFQPLLLAEITWPGVLTIYLSTHKVTYAGNAYLPRTIDQNLTATQALSEQGISLTPTVTLKLADADAFLYTNIEAVYGFKGAKLKLTFVFWEVGTSNFSSDSMVKFVGQCGPPQIDDKSLTITAINKINLAPQNLPSIQIQPFCPWVFPITADLQEAAANGTNQQSKECPYNPAGVTNPRGNLNPASSAPYTSCGKTKQDCVDRGMYTIDSSARKTGSFGGIQYNPPSSTISRSYLSGNWEQVFNTSNEAKYGDLVPLMNGEGWMTRCLVVDSSNDANYTQFECLLCYGKVDIIFKVLVNGIEIPHGIGDPTFPDTVAGVTSQKDADRIGSWRGVNDGSVFGTPNPVAGYDSKGDPYGSLTVLNIQVVNSIGQAGSIPDVQVLFRFAGTRIYTTPTTFTVGFTSNPVWHLMDALTWLNLEYEELDIQSFIDAAFYSGFLIDYVSQFGVSTAHNRFDSTLAMRQRQDGATAIRSMLNAIRGILLPNYDNGLFKLVIKQTLGDQQPAPMDGSNYNTAVPSFDSNGDPKDGYWAYYFREGTIAEDDQGGTTLKISQDQLQNAPNKVGFTFQDVENTYSSDAISIVQDEDVARTGQVFPGSIQVAGVNTYDQGQRIIANFFAERMRGNGRLAADGETIGDTGGTLSFEFETSHRVVKVHVGDIVGGDSVKYGFTGQSFRVRQIQPTANFERTKVVMDWHNDAWYMDFFGQTGAKKWTSGYKSAGLGGARALIASAAPFLSDVVDPEFDNATPNQCLSEMALDPVQYSSAGGTSTARLIVRVAPPANVFDDALSPPFVPVQSLTANTGGALGGGITYYLQFVALSANGQSRLSASTKVFVPAGAATNTISTPKLFWDPDTTGFMVYAGIAPDRVYLQTGNYSASGGTGAQPDTVTITGKLTQLGEAPDPKLALIRFKAKPVVFPGIVTAVLSSASFASGSWTLGLITGFSFATNALVGRKVALLGRASAAEPEIYPMALTVTANTATTLTVTGDVLNAAALAPGDQVTVRYQPTIGSDMTGNYIEDPFATWMNFVVPAGWFSVGAGVVVPTAKGLAVRIVQGTGEGTTATIASSTATRLYISGKWPITPDATSIFVIENPAWFLTSDTSKISNNGSMGIIPCTLDVSSWRGQTWLVQAVAVDTNGNEAPDFGAPIREAYVLGAGGGGDSGDPQAPSFLIRTDYRGNLILYNVGFVSSDNITTVSTGTLQLFLWDMNKAASGPDTTLSGSVTSSVTTLSITSVITPFVGQIAMIGTELVTIVGSSPTDITVVRAALSSAATAHSSGDGIFLLDNVVRTVPFSPLFFTLPLSANYESSMQMPNKLLAAAQMYVTNQIGNGPATDLSFTSLPGFGLTNIPAAGILSGVGGIADTFGVAGILAIGSDLATPYQRDTITQPREMIAQVRQASVGADIVIHINVGASLYQTMTIPAGATLAVASGPLAALPAGQPITLDITSVGTTFPGSDLGLTIFG